MFSAAALGCEKKTRRAYRLWKQNPNHPSLQFNKKSRGVHLPSVPSLSLRMPVMKNKPYSHKDKPLTQSIAEEIISSRIYTKSIDGASIASITKLMCRTHEEEGGLPAEKDLEEIAKRALQNLSHSGKANRISSDLWIIPRYPYQQIFGSGKHWVYLYYFSADKKEAESNYKSVWRCKIGKADKNPENRVKSQTSGVPVPLELLFFSEQMNTLHWRRQYTES